MHSPTVATTTQRIARLFTVLIAFAVTVISHPTTAQDALDLDAPQISHSPNSTYLAGKPAQISARVTDNLGVSRVRLYHRASPDAMFEEMPMRRVGATDNYVTAIDTKTDQASIEYYIEAEDISANIIAYPVKTIELIPDTSPPVTVSADPTATTQAETTPIEDKKRVSPIVYGVLGALVLGALVASSSSSSGGGDDAAITGTIEGDCGDCGDGETDGGDGTDVGDGDTDGGDGDTGGGGFYIPLWSSSW